MELTWYIPQLTLALTWTHTVANVVHRDVKAKTASSAKEDGSSCQISAAQRGCYLTTTTTYPPCRHSAIVIRHGNVIAPPPLLYGDHLVTSPSRHVTSHTEQQITSLQEVLTTYESFLLSYAADDPALEEDEGRERDVARGYDASVDWWSTGAMTYELAYGVAPFWAEDVGITYERIRDSQAGLSVVVGTRNPVETDRLREDLVGDPRTTEMVELPSIRNDRLVPRPTLQVDLRPSPCVPFFPPADDDRKNLLPPPKRTAGSHPPNGDWAD